MVSGNMIANESGRLFRDWFQSEEENIVRAKRQHDYDWLTHNLTPRVQALNPVDSKISINWELGPGTSRQWQFVLSPLVRANLSKVESVITQAPDLPNWEFHACKPPKPAPQCYTIELLSESGSIQIDSFDWSYIVKYNTSDLIEILLVASPLPMMSEADKVRLSYLLVENILGERLVLKYFGKIYVMDQESIPSSIQLRPFSGFRDFIAAIIEMKFKEGSK